MIVYRALNKKSGKSYVGQTKNSLDVRVSSHIASVKAGSKWIFHNALRSYGTEGFVWTTLQECKTKSELDEAECYWIEKLECNYSKNGYNMMPGGTGGYNENASIAATKRCKGKTYEEMYGKEKAETIKNSIRKHTVARNKKYGGWCKDPLRRIEIGKIGNAVRTKMGYTHSEETKKKLSDTLTGRVFTEEWKENISIGTKKAMAKLDQKELQRKALAGRRKAWAKRDELRIDKIKQLLLHNMKSKDMIKELGISPPTFYRLMKIIKKSLAFKK